MNIIRIALSLLCICTLAGAMQQQQQIQRQEQTHNTPQNPGQDQPNDDSAPDAKDSELADLNALMQNLINTVIQNHGSVDTFIKQNQKRKILCHICQLETCPFTKEEEL